MDLTIIITTYNSANIIKKCVDNIINQKFNGQILISDDCSSDGTQEIILEISRCFSNVKYFLNEKNIGLVSNRKNAIKLVTTKWFTFLDVDDCLNLNVLNEINLCNIEKSILLPMIAIESARVWPFNFVCKDYIKTMLLSYWSTCSIIFNKKDFESIIFTKYNFAEDINTYQLYFLQKILPIKTKNFFYIYNKNYNQENMNVINENNLFEFFENWKNTFRFCTTTTDKKILLFHLIKKFVENNEKFNLNYYDLFLNSINDIKLKKFINKVSLVFYKKNNKFLVVLLSLSSKVIFYRFIYKKIISSLKSIKIINNYFKFKNTL